MSRLRFITPPPSPRDRSPAWTPAVGLPPRFFPSPKQLSAEELERRLQARRALGQYETRAYAYCTLLYTDSYLQGVLALAASLRVSGTPFPLLVLVPGAAGMLHRQAQERRVGRESSGLSVETIAACHEAEREDTCKQRRGRGDGERGERGERVERKEGREDKG